MNIDELREEMEEDLTWRSTELRMLRNNLSSIYKNEDKEKYRKSLVVMLYAHFEGYTKICFLIYLKFINSKNIKRINIMGKPEIIASCMNEVFKKYDDKDRKNSFFKRKCPDDKFLHAIYRRADLISEFDNFFNEYISIADGVIDTESNLWSHVLAKNFYKVGINHEIFKKYNKDIDQLVNLRNSIAHGTKKTGIEEGKYNNLERKITKNVMEKLIEVFVNEANILDEICKKSLTSNFT